MIPGGSSFLTGTVIMRLTPAVCASAFLMLCLAACAGTPPPGEQASAHSHAKCEQSTGSLLCGNGDDQPYASANAPGGSTPRSNGTQSALTGSK